MLEWTMHEKNTLILAALEQIRLYQYIPFDIQVRKEGSLNTTLETLESDDLKLGWLYIVQTITCIELGSGTPQIKIGLKTETTKRIYESGTPANAEDSIEYVGQLFVGEKKKIYADFESCTEADTIEMNINGYRITNKQ